MSVYKRVVLCIFTFKRLLLCTDPCIWVGLWRCAFERVYLNIFKNFTLKTSLNSCVSLATVKFFRKLVWGFNLPSLIWYKYFSFIFLQLLDAILVVVITAIKMQELGLAVTIFTKTFHLNGFLVTTEFLFYSTF